MNFNLNEDLTTEIEVAGLLDASNDRKIDYIYLKRNIFI